MLSSLLSHPFASSLRPTAALGILAGGEDSGGGSGLASFGLLLLVPVAMYFLLIRPQRRRQREQAAQQAGVEVGDEIMTTAGLYGFITGFDGDIVWVEIDDNVQIRVARAAIQRKVDTSAKQGAADSPAPTHKADDAGSSSTPISDIVDDTEDK